jgi:DNA mismatch repair protein MLH3
VSLLTIASCHHEYRSHNSITFHHSKVVNRQLPATAAQELPGKHGTRVVVRNLFGNLPVRVKQRTRAAEHKSEHDRLWEGVKKEVTGLLLSWGGPVAVRLRDGDNRLILNLNTNGKESAQSRASTTNKPRSIHLSSLLNVLTQARYISVDKWSSWVPASASTSALSIKGAISQEPAPSKSLQFISLGIRPLSAETEHNELYDEVNRLFGLSSFGVLEDAHIDDREKLRRQTDKRFKNDGYTNRELKVQKGVDRYPMFHLRILLRSGVSHKSAEDTFIADDTNLQAVVQVLSAMITQWLSVHHFRPRQPRKRRLRPSTAHTDFSELDTREVASASDTPHSLGGQSGHAGLSPLRTSKREAANAASLKRTRSATANRHDTMDRPPNQAFAEWSRIKSGNANFFNSLTVPKQTMGGYEHSISKDKSINTTESPLRPPRTENCATFNIESVAQGALSMHTPLDATPEELLGASATEHARVDDTMLWTDPSTKRVYSLNARTGCVMPDDRLRPHTDPNPSTFRGIRMDTHKSLRLPPKSATAGTAPWLDNVLTTWDNPVFKPREKRIRHVSMQDHEHEHASASHVQHRCNRIDMNKVFVDSPATGSTRFSKDGLKDAKVIAQVDKKFILVKMNGYQETTEQGASAEMLVLIDQHAADERVQVEALFQELCTPTPQSNSRLVYRSKLGHSAQVVSIMLGKPTQFAISQQELGHFTMHAARFANWGILFDVLDQPSAISKPGKQHLLSVTALPLSISERCKADPQVLISFLRTTVWKYATESHPPPLAPPTRSAGATDWIQRLATCPPGLIDMINSRACRSAIMFNDELSIDQCTQLVQKLAASAFPFMCAHGRPSTVPLVDLGSLDVGEEVGREGAARGGFVESWKKWRH